MRPRARRDRVVVEQLEDETLVYDLQRDEAHCLNRTAALVWRYCDGRTTVAQMAARLHRDSGAPADERVVWLALKQLGQAHLLREQPVTPPGRAVSRRSLLRIGLVGALVPAVFSIVAPEAVEGASCSAATGRANGCPCTSGTQCASGRCGGSPKICF